MIKINYPSPEFRIKEEAGKDWIFDELRKQWVRLSPEEWVRQNILVYLIKTLSYPASLIAVEKEISLGTLKKRFDILIYKNALPWMIIECKEMNIGLNRTVLEQALNYHITLQTPYLIITNGKDTLGFHLSVDGVKEIDTFPSFQ